MPLLVVLLLASPGLTQGLAVEGDPFADISAVDAAHMSALSGQSGANGLPAKAGQANGPECGTECGTDLATSLGTPASRQAIHGNLTGVNVTAVNNQSSNIGTAIIHNSGGLNSASGGN